MVVATLLGFWPLLKMVLATKNLTFVVVTSPYLKGSLFCKDALWPKTHFILLKLYKEEKYYIKEFHYKLFLATRKWVFNHAWKTWHIIEGVECH